MDKTIKIIVCYRCKRPVTDQGRKGKLCLACYAKKKFGNEAIESMVLYHNLKAMNLP